MSAAILGDKIVYDGGECCLAGRFNWVATLALSLKSMAQT
jgi:hypothetical protein